MVRAKHFSIQEYVPPEIYQQRGEKAWELIDPRLIVINDLLRERFGPMFINTWSLGRSTQDVYGYRTQSGFRTAEFYRRPGDDDMAMLRRYATSLSQHKFGRATDSLFRDVTAEEVRAYVKACPTEFPGLAAIEEDVNWFHGDVRNCTALKLFYP